MELTTVFPLLSPSNPRDPCFGWTSIYFCAKIVRILIGLLIVGGLFSVYLNLKLAYIIVRTFGEESKSSYYPILLLISILSWPPSICLFFVLFFEYGLHAIGFDFFYLQAKVTNFNLIAFILFIWSLFAYPLIHSFLDFLLCIHRLFCMFGSFELMKTKFRWFGPLLFVIFLPFLVIIVGMAYSYGSGLGHWKGESSDIVFNSFYFSFLLDKISRLLFTFSSVCGYLAILKHVVGTKTRVGREASSDDIYIIKQVLPIAIFQLIFVVLHVSCETNFACSNGTKLYLDVLTFLISTIVAPISIILGNPLKRKIYWSTYCCYEKKKKQVAPKRRKGSDDL